MVLIAPWVLHRHRLLWSEPDRFDPERFLPDAAPPSRYAYLPFGIGPRVCIGAQFALTEATLVLATLIHCSASSAPTTSRSLREPSSPPSPTTPRHSCSAHAARH